MLCGSFRGHNSPASFFRRSVAQQNYSQGLRRLLRYFMNAFDVGQGSATSFHGYVCSEGRSSRRQVSSRFRGN